MTVTDRCTDTRPHGPHRAQYGGFGVKDCPGVAAPAPEPTTTDNRAMPTGAEPCRGCHACTTGPDSDEPLAFDYATTCPLLVLDDLGRERVTDWWLEQLQRIVDARCANERRLIVTTNTAGSADAAYDELVTRYGHPVTERLIDDGGVLVLDGPAVRRVVNEW